jgi:glycosyltransferase involved in cell wall biosynthesis
MCVAVIVSCYNPCCARLDDVIRSAYISPVSQLIISDDGSENWEEIDQLVTFLKRDINLVYIRSNENHGLGAAILRASSFISAGASHILYLDQDTIVAEGYIRRLFTRADQIFNEAPPIIYCGLHQCSKKVQTRYKAGRELVSKRMVMLSGCLFTLRFWYQWVSLMPGLKTDYIDTWLCDYVRMIGGTCIIDTRLILYHQLGDYSLHLPMNKLICCHNSARRMESRGTDLAVLTKESLTYRAALFATYEVLKLFACYFCLFIACGKARYLILYLTFIEGFFKKLCEKDNGRLSLCN